MARAAPVHRLTSVHIHLLGPLAIEIHSTDSRGGSAKGSFARLPTRKAESLLAYLILHPESHAREKLAALFWGDMGDAQARASLRNALAILRKHLGDPALGPAAVSTWPANFDALFSVGPETPPRPARGRR